MDVVKELVARGAKVNSYMKVRVPIPFTVTQCHMLSDVYPIARTCDALSLCVLYVMDKTQFMCTESVLNGFLLLLLLNSFKQKIYLKLLGFWTLSIIRYSRK
jgi:hypothetical protein